MKRSSLTRKTPMRRTAFKQYFKDAVANRELLQKGSFRRALTAARKAAEDPAANRPAKRSGKNAASAVVDLVTKRQGLPRISPARIAQRQEYHRLGPAYLEAHPYCQITIAILGLDEADVIKHHGAYGKPQFGTKGERPARIYHVSRANQLHHRNKANGIRLIDFNYIMSACDGAHDWTEKKKDQARAIGILCPINCKPDGTMPDGTKQPTTPELLAQRHAEKAKS